MNTNEIMVKMVLDRWYANMTSFNDMLNAFTDEHIEKEIAPNKNRGTYLLGHLAAVHDSMMPLLGFGDKLYPALFEPFIQLPDKAVTELPSIKDLRTMWASVNNTLSEKIATLQTDDWFQRHTSVSEEDFMKEPHRNKLNIIVTRTTHLCYHSGQFILLK